MSERTKTQREPITTRHWFTAVLALTALSFIPVLGFLSAVLLVCVLVGWLVYDLHGFLSVAWRTFLIIVLAYSVLLLCDAFIWHRSDYDYCRFPYRTAAMIGFGLSACGLVCSFLKAKRDRLE